jgi:hypothetical protein
VTEELVTEELVTEELVTEELVTEELVTEELVTEELVTEEPIFLVGFVTDPEIVDLPTEEPVAVEDPVPAVDETTDYGDSSTSDPLVGETSDEGFDDIPEETTDESVVEDVGVDWETIADSDAEAEKPAEVEAEPVAEFLATQRDAMFQTTVAPLPVGVAAPVTATPRPGRLSSFFGGFGGWGGSSAADDSGDSGFVEDGPRGRRRRPWPRAGG